MPRAEPEAEIQRAVMAHLRCRGVRGAFAWHTPNGGYRTPAEAGILKSLGVVAGVPDVLILHDGQLYALELKAPKGRPSSSQVRTMLALEAAGATTALAVGLDEALATLQRWGLLRPSSEAIGRVA